RVIQRPLQTAYDACCQGPLQAEWIADRQHFLTDLQTLRGAHLDHGQPTSRSVYLNHCRVIVTVGAYDVPGVLLIFDLYIQVGRRPDDVVVRKYMAFLIDD